jgi:Na+-driven multidrug efflux pump
LDLLLIPRWGMIGAAVASTCSYLTSSVVTVALFCRVTGFSPLQVLRPTSEDARLLSSVVVRAWHAASLRFIQS